MSSGPGRGLMPMLNGARKYPLTNVRQPSWFDGGFRFRRGRRGSWRSIRRGGGCGSSDGGCSFGSPGSGRGRRGRRSVRSGLRAVFGRGLVRGLLSCGWTSHDTHTQHERH